jgi:hypothetical protein
VAFEHDDDPDSGWLQSMYEGKDEIIYAVDRTMIQMREELYGPDATAPPTGPIPAELFDQVAGRQRAEIASWLPSWRHNSVTGGRKNE